MAFSMQVKTDLAGEMRRLTLSSDATYDVLVETLTALYPAAFPAVAVKYTDEDDDLITISSTSELAYAMDIARKAGRRTLRLTLIPTSAAPGHAAFTAPPAPAPAPALASTPAPVAAAMASASAAADAATARAAEAAASAQRAADAAAQRAAQAARAGAPPRAGTFADVNEFVSALGGLERFLPSFLGMMGAAGAGAPPPPPQPPFAPQPPLSAPPPPSPFGAGSGAGYAHYAGRHGGWGRRGGRGRRGPRGPGMRGPGMHEFSCGSASAFGPMAGAMFAVVQREISNVTPETKRALQELIAYIVRAGQQFVALGAVRETVPAIRVWLTNNLTEAGALTQAAITALIDAIRPAVESRLGPNTMEQVAAFLRVALVDNAIVNMLRNLDPANLPEEMGDNDVEMGENDVDIGVDIGRMFGMGEASGGRDPGRHEGRGASGTAPTFDTHIGVECDSCGTVPIVGDRHKSKSRPDFDLCAARFADPSKKEEGEEFLLYKFPWETSNNYVVPPAPLGVRDRSPHVAHLQKLLVQLGYMNNDMVGRAVGHFGPRTQSALERFQREYGLEGSVQLGAYDEITRGALFSIVDSGVPVRTAAGTGGETSGPSDGTASGETPSVREGTA